MRLHLLSCIINPFIKIVHNNGSYLFNQSRPTNWSVPKLVFRRNSTSNAQLPIRQRCCIRHRPWQSQAITLQSSILIICPPIICSITQMDPPHLKIRLNVVQTCFFFLHQKSQNLSRSHSGPLYSRWSLAPGHVWNQYRKRNWCIFAW